MITKVPETWQYNQEMEMLFIFYQCVDELTSEHTKDTYALPLHNSMTLSYEMNEISSDLQQFGMTENYYNKYVIVIIDEFLDNLKNDKILKNSIGQRLDSITKGFEEAKTNPNLLKRWVNQLHQSCNIDKYLELYKIEIINLVVNSKDKTVLIECIKRYFTSLIFVGYTREYLYVTSKRFFCNYNKTIDNKLLIKDFLDTFDCRSKKFEFLVLLDLNSIDYIDGISKNLVISKRIKKINIEEEKAELLKDNNVEGLYKQYYDLSKNANKHQKISIVKYEVNSMDQYIAIDEFNTHLNIIQSFSIYFKHHRLYKQIFQILLKGDGDQYVPINIPSKMLKRPYIQQENIDFRIRKILKGESLSHEAFTSLTNAITMHSEALDSENVNTLIKSLWTSLESLFSNVGTSEVKINVIDSAVAIIQKTYFLKIMSSLYSQVLESISKEDVIELNIDTFVKFIEYFSAHNASSMRPLYGKLGNNLLLRTRIFRLRNDLNDGQKILKYLENHEIKIRYQLLRIQRTRNIATHLGVEMYYSNVIINHLHNYFDLMCNYLICKICNGDYVSNIAAVVFEARNDYNIHKEKLKTGELLSIENYSSYFFGPDVRLINYELES